MFQLPKIEFQFIVFMLVQLTNASCFPLHVVLSDAVTNLLVVEESDISSAFNTTAHVLVFTLDTGAVGNDMLVSVIDVTCHNVLVVIVGTLVEVHLEV
jgi:hypothetical protein